MLAPVLTAPPLPERSYLPRRVDTYCKISVGLLCVALSVTALCCAILWHRPWLCLPFGIGVLGSGYLTYVAYASRHMKNLEEEVSTLQATHRQFKIDQEAFSAEARTHTAALAEQAQKFQEENSQLEKTCGTLRAEIEDLRKENLSLTQIRETMEHDVAALLSSLQTLSLSQEKGQRRFEGGLTLLNQQLVQAQALLSQGAQAEQKLSALSKELEQLFASLSAWIKQYDTPSLLQSVTTLTAQYQTLTTLVQEQTTLHRSLEETAVGLRKEVQDLERIKKELEVCVSKLTERV